MANSMVQLDKEENKEMMIIWQDIVRDTMEMAKNLITPDVADWIEKMLQYTVPGGKKIRSLTLIYAYKSLVSKDQLTEDNIRLVRILAWCVELMQASLIVIEDIQNQSLLRRGQPCWYRCNDIDKAAINDYILLQNTIYYILQKYFKDKECYVSLVETFQEALFMTVMGQYLDFFSTELSKRPNLDLFTMDRYSSIVEYKESHYSVILPVVVAMHLAGIKDLNMFKQANVILLDIGHLFQVQIDYLNCFGDSDVYGKDSTDIQKGKCTWLIVAALLRATSEQRKVLKECYGILDPQKIKRVKQIFIDLDLPNAYNMYKEHMYNVINGRIEQISCELPHSLFLNLLEKLYHQSS
ncbi:farnesyl pyrophosphate synthase [Solenopsis invicta]|uniref:farnesyl pyrophosphate synthase n=1 Tax=Solenopsis invicta TaxID=13686 RepID=UPI0001FEB830|nr:farnesyl pyrophosphate synthase [Solenopsis invicta]XP_025997312.1 farnesyl pyrophosphate synthase [Solenopsis invicta]XP_039306127.1 farnesyl pyrophosphate synthase [Solenopsis invicta]